MAYIIVLLIILGIFLCLGESVMDGIKSIVWGIEQGDAIKYVLFFAVCAIACFMLAFLFDSSIFYLIARFFLVLVVLVLVIFVGMKIFNS